jgi:hypothetical protein
MIRRALIAFLAAIALSNLESAFADTLIIDGVSQSADTVSERPSRGLSMDKVASAWGEPQTRQSPVGDPPISRWEYSGFIVYFEYQHVIHAVQKN